MGDVTVTVRNLRVLGVDKEENLLVVEGAVPGPGERLPGDYQGQEATQRAPWIQRRGLDDQPVEGIQARLQGQVRFASPVEQIATGER